jgi:hypothetical protein
MVPSAVAISVISVSAPGIGAWSAAGEVGVGPEAGQRRCGVAAGGVGGESSAMVVGEEVDDVEARSGAGRAQGHVAFARAAGEVW